MLALAGMSSAGVAQQMFPQRPVFAGRWTDPYNGVTGLYVTAQDVCNVRADLIDLGPDSRPVTAVPQYVKSSVYDTPYTGWAAFDICRDAHTWLFGYAYRQWECPPNYAFTTDGVTRYCGSQWPYIDRWHDKPQNSCQPSGGNPIYPLTGNKRQHEVLVRWSPNEPPLAVVYDNRRKLPNDDPEGAFAVTAAPSFGGLWESGLHKRLLVQMGQSSNTHVQVSRGAATWVSFIRGIASESQMPDSDVRDRLLELGTAWRYVDASAQSQETYDRTGAITAVAYARGSGLAYSYSDSSTPVTVAPKAGLLVKIQDPFGRALRFEYEQPAGVITPRIARVVDPDNQIIQANYDAAGNLSRLTWPDTQFRQFRYEQSALPWALTGIVDENGERHSNYTYDSAGRAQSTEYAGGVNRYSLSYGSAPRWVTTETFDATLGVFWRDHNWQLPQDAVMTTPNGTAVNLGATLVSGMPRVTTRSQPAGSGCDAASSSLSYDANGNIASKTDFNGSKSCHAHDLGRNLETVRIDGLGSADTCPADIGGYAIPAGALPRKTTTQWHPDWSLPVRQAVPEQITTSIYNGQPDPTAGNAIASCAPPSAVLPDGKPIAVLCKKVEQATDDATGSLGLGATPAAGGIETDSSFHQVSLLLHMDGLAGGISFPDSSERAHAASSIASPLTTDPSSTKFGSAAGNFAGGYLQYPASPDWDMGAGDFTVELWAKFNTASAGSRVLILGQGASTGGDQTFYLGKNTDNKLIMGLTTTGVSAAAVGASTVAANTWHHIALVRLGNVLTLYKDGLMEATAAVSGAVPSRSARFSIGALGEYVATYGGAYGTKMMGWLDEVRITKGVGRYTGSFSIPSHPFGNAGEVAQAAPAASASFTSAPRIHTWTYNQHGQTLTARDPLNKLTTYAYYSDTTADHTLGDLQRVTDSKGRVTQYTRYDRSGRLRQSIDANGTVTDTSYTPRGWVQSISVTTPGRAPRTSTYNYDGVGQLKKATLPDEVALEYTYDAAHRLTGIKDTAGNSVAYTLDNMGNRTGEDLKDPGGNLLRNATRVYDALNRVQSTTGGLQ